MPSKSPKQHRLMEAVKHNPEFAKKVGIKQSVGADFVAADKGKGFEKGGLNQFQRWRKRKASKKSPSVKKNSYNY